MTVGACLGAASCTSKNTAVHSGADSGFEGMVCGSRADALQHWHAIVQLVSGVGGSAGEAQGALLPAGGRVPVIHAGACLHGGRLRQALCPPGTHCSTRRKAAAVLSCMMARSPLHQAQPPVARGAILFPHALLQLMPFGDILTALTLAAYPAGAMIAIAFVHNLLRRHPACTVLLHRQTLAALEPQKDAAGVTEHHELANGQQDSLAPVTERPSEQSAGKASKKSRRALQQSATAADMQQSCRKPIESAAEEAAGPPAVEHRVSGSGAQHTTEGGAAPGQDVFDAAEDDPGKSRGIESSLWEIKSLRNHYCPQVRWLLLACFNESASAEPQYSRTSELGLFLPAHDVIAADSLELKFTMPLFSGGGLCGSAGQGFGRQKEDCRGRHRTAADIVLLSTVSRGARKASQARACRILCAEAQPAL